MSKSVFHLADGEAIVTETPEERAKREMEEFSVNNFVSAIKDDLQANKICLPTLPTYALEALLVINDAGSSAADLEKVISKDTALTARLIRYANSPLYRGINKVTAIKLAITRIGFQRVKNAVYAVSMKEVFRTPINIIEKRMETLWAHSVKVGSQAALMAKDYRHLDPDVALVAGLVHDIGHIPLLIKACEYEELINRPDHLDRLTQKLHTQVGGWITKLWEFDPAIVSVVVEHENLNRRPGDTVVDYVDLIQVANILAYEETEHRLAKIDRKSVAAFNRLGLSENPEETTAMNEDTQAVAEIVF